jgi:FdhD protein
MFFLGVRKMDKIIKHEVVKYDRCDKKIIEETMIYEYPLSIFVNGKNITTLTCTPEKLEALTKGFLRTQGIINSSCDIESFELDEENGIAKVQLKGKNNTLLNKNIFPVGFNQKNSSEFFLRLIEVNNYKIVDSHMSLDIPRIYGFMEQNLAYSETYKLTGGAHCVALCDRESILVICEDVARHNAMDKVIGEALIRNIPLEDKIVLVSGRVSYEMIAKTARFGIPIIISKSAPTSLSIGLAKALKVTLIGFVRGERMNVYTSPERVK